MSDQDVIRTCHTCGASNAAEAQFCGTCGRELLEEPAGADTVFQSNPVAAPQQGDVSTHIADAPGQERAERQLAEMEAASQAPAEGAMQKRCSWCGAMNPWVAAVCESCEARFPVPGQDEAFLRAAEERLRQQEASLERLRQQRRRPWRRWF
jgi:ribosomal protein L40E